MNVLDCHYRADTRLARELSNLYPWPFVLDDVQCGSIEGFLQSLKFSDPDEQVAVATLHGPEAFLTGQHGNDWKETQVLWWRGKKFPRTYKKYQALLTRAYDACFDQNAGFIAALYETGALVLSHDMGKTNQTQSTLTQMEYLVQLYRLRARAQQMIDSDRTSSGG